MFRCVIIFSRRLAEAHRIHWKCLSTLLCVVILSGQLAEMYLLSGACMIWSYSWILRCVVTLYGQMAEVYLLSWTCLSMIRVSVCVISFLPNPAVHRAASAEMCSLPPYFRLILTFSYCFYEFLREQELGTGRSPDTDKADSFHGQIRWAKLNDFAPDIQDAMELWALRPHARLVKVISVCSLHVFFHQYVADLREERSENVLRTVFASPFIFDVTVSSTSG